MIVLKSKVFFPEGNVLINEQKADSDFGGAARRINRRATIDGGSFIDDFGFSDGDRTIRVGAGALSVADYKKVKKLIRLFGSLEIITPEGVFDGAIQVANNREKFEMTFLVKGRLDG